MIAVVNLLNGPSQAMNVNGQVTPQTFSYSPSVGRAKVLALVCLMRDEGTCSFTNFGAIQGLSANTGLLIQAVQSDAPTEITTIRSNADLTTRFYKNQFGSSAVLSLLGITTPVGFGNSTNAFVGVLEFNPDYPIILDNLDSLQVVVRDNLSAVDLLNMVVIVARS